jgi:hypothetical protein
MNKLALYTALALLTLAASSGCGRNWTSWFCRGEVCDTCETTGAVYSSDYHPSVESMPETLPPLRN